MSAAPRLTNPTLKPSEFADYFEAIHGVQPFPWQVRLSHQVTETGHWPDTIELPTAAGKTAALDIAVFALALDALKPPPECHALRRIFFCIDRRIVVDEAERRAKLIADHLSEARDGILGRVAALLRSLSGEQLPLHVAKMRGGVWRDMSWARSPSQPTICLTTVDQLGSRLLFRGYGLRDRALPIHAGLIAHNSLILLDEVHIARPFEQTLSAVQRYAGWAEEPLGRPLQIVRISATAPPKPDAERFTLEADDLEHPVLGKRLTSRKLARLELTSDRDRMISAIFAGARELLSANPRRRVLAIVVNRVATARAIFEQLRGNSDHDVVLLTGRVRPFERDTLLDDLMPRVRAGRDLTVEQKPLVVVATQCVEVGADFDFDALITECAPLDSLRQRLGRLDRFGGLAESPVVVFANKADLRGKDLVYGEATTATWKWLNAKLPKGKKQPRLIDLGTCSRIFESRSAEELIDLSAPVSLAPILLPAYCDLFAQTSPLPAADPEPALFLQGPEAGAPDVYLVWRAELDATEPESWAGRVVLPPLTDEALALPIYAARAFFSGADSNEIADTESIMDTALPKMANNGRLALRWKGDDSTLVRADELRPGDTLIVPASYGGCDRFGWYPTFARPTEDLADAAAMRRRQGSPVLRIHPTLMPDGVVRAALGTVLDAIEAGEPHVFIMHAIKQCLMAISASPSTSEAQQRAAEALTAGNFKWTLYPSGDGLLIEARRPLDASEEDESSCTGRPITLVAHSEGVRDYAGHFAAAAGLPPHLVEDEKLAGWLHDGGKADPRCQVMLHRGSEGAFLAALEPLAKSGMDRRDRQAWHAARELSGYPRRARHECQSVALVSSNEALLARAHDPDLVLHLIASHHGCCRPFAPVVEDPAPVIVRLQHGDYFLEASSAHGLERLDSGVAERFWRLVRRYGWFGLAYLEAILRLADHRRSEDEQEQQL